MLHHRHMKKIPLTFIVMVISILWFLVLPFPFVPDWSILGGYHLVQAQLFVNENTEKYHFASYLSLLFFCLFSLGLGFLSYKILLRHQQKTARN
jgi:flagellar biosynthesis component FlhA